MKHTTIKLLLATVFLGIGLCASGNTKAQAVSEATAIINRFTSNTYSPLLELNLQKTVEGHDQYIISAENGRLKIEASSGVALCHAFYSWVRRCHAGIMTWSGQRFDARQMRLPEKPVAVVSPYRDHQYFNVVTFGYTMAYWDQARWDREVDWMALHGIDMPLAITGQEYVERIVFRKLGLSLEEIKAWETGPAHLPWKRMGNIGGNAYEGPLSDAWLQKQVDLERHLLERYRTLGMKPICPAFSGFVPEAFGKHFGGATQVGWNWAFKEGNMLNHRLMPDSPWFTRVGKLFVETWDSVFSPCKYYLSDSFNEMTIPTDTLTLTAYGDSIWASIHRANPNAVWVMQGWTLGYQRKEWGSGRLRSLLKGVPDDRFMLLDMATDYNKDIWHNGYNWDSFPRFYNKEWVWSVIPNMGGKTIKTGKIDYYANGRLDALRSDNRGHLTGYGIAPEGIENNEMLYELIADGGWTDAPIDLDEWLEGYALSRYGLYNKGVKAYYDGLRHSVYSTFFDHPRFNWQFAVRAKRGDGTFNEAYYKGVEQWIDNAPSEVSPYMLEDMAEAVAFYCGAKADSLLCVYKDLVDKGQKSEARKLAPVLRRLLMSVDTAMTLHPDYNLSEWEGKAQRMASTRQEAKTFAVNARRLVSTWMPLTPSDNRPIDDYSSRVWSGLVRDYYLPRMENYMNQLLGKKQKPLKQWENSWVETAPRLSPTPRLPKDKVGMLKGMVDWAKRL